MEAPGEKAATLPWVGGSQTAEQEGLGGARWTSAWRGAAGEAGQGPGLLCALLLCDGETAQRSLPLRHRNGLTARHTPFSAPMSPSCCGVDRVSKRKACNSGRLWAVEALTLPEAPPCCPLSSLVGISNVGGGGGREEGTTGLRKYAGPGLLAATRCSGPWGLPPQLPPQVTQSPVSQHPGHGRPWEAPLGQATQAAGC